ncbi:MAG: hypothetical protein GQ582_05190 [Methyloprofundus sp.]|nr:hypothetical protein [Methyloprofundus sp.]
MCVRRCFKGLSCARFCENIKASYKIALAALFSRMLYPLLYPLVNMVILIILADFGEASAAAYGVGIRIEFLLLSISIALSSIIPPVFGQNHAAKQGKRSGKIIRLSMSISFIANSVIYILVYFSAEPIAQLFTSDLEVQTLTIQFLHILPLSYPCFGFTLIISQVLITLHQPFKSLSLVIIHQLILSLPLAWIGVNLWGIMDLYWGLLCANVLTGIGVYFYGRKLSFVIEKAVS